MCTAAAAGAAAVVLSLSAIFGDASSGVDPERPSSAFVVVGGGGGGAAGVFTTNLGPLNADTAACRPNSFPRAQQAAHPQVSAPQFYMIAGAGGASTYWQSRFQKNNSAITGHGSMIMAYYYNVGGRDETATDSLTIQLAANDEITLHAQANGAQNGEFYGPNCNFGGHLLG